MKMLKDSLKVLLNNLKKEDELKTHLPFILPLKSYQ